MPYQKYTHTFSGKPSENAADHFQGYMDFMTTMTTGQPAGSQAYTYEYFINGFRESLAGDARAWMREQQFTSQGELKKAFMNMFGKPRNAGTDSIVIATKMKDSDNLDTWAGKLSRALTRMETPEHKKIEILKTHIAPHLINFAYNLRLPTFKETLAECREYSRSVIPTLSAHTPNTNLTLQSEPNSLNTELIASMQQFGEKFDKFASRGRKREKRDQTPIPSRHLRKETKSVSFDRQSGSSSRQSSKSRSPSRHSSRSGSTTRSESETRHSRPQERRSSSKSDSRPSKSTKRHSDSYQTQRHSSTHRKDECKCHNCGKYGHKWRNCPLPRQQPNMRQYSERSSLNAFIGDAPTGFHHNSK